MIIDYPKQIKEKLLRLIAIPKNSEVIYYDKNFIDLINVNVDKLYQDQLSKYESLQSEYSKIQGRLNDYESKVQSMSISNKSMTEEDYIKEIQRLEIEYTQKYSKIKQLESKLNSIKSTLLAQKEKIKIQQAKDESEIQNQNEKIEKENQEIKSKLLILKAKEEVCEMQIEGLIELIQAYREKYELYDINKMITKTGKIKCAFCGALTIPETESEKENLIAKNQIKRQSIAGKVLVRNQTLAKRKEELEEIQKQIANIEAKLATNENSTIIPNLYIKKSEKVLKLEAKKFEIEDELEKVYKEYTKLTKAEGRSFSAMKEKLDNYKESLSNIISLRNEKDNLQEEIKLGKELQEDIKSMEDVLKFYAKFLMIRNKMIEKRMSELFDGKVTFEFYQLDNFYIKKVYKIFYNKIEIQFLNLDEQKELENLIQEKIKLLN